MRWINTFTIALCFYRTTSGQYTNQILLETSYGGIRQVLTPEFSDYIDRVLNRNSVPGISLGVIRKDGTFELGAWGSKTDDGEPVTPDTLFCIGSSSKAFTAGAIGILMDDFASGRNTTPLPPGLNSFDWNTKVKDLLPGQWGLKDEWASEKASIRDILGHVSGLARHDNSYGLLDTPESIVLRLRSLEPYYEIRETWHYNNMMYIVAAHIVSTYTGSFTAFVKERIFDPLNMTSTTYSLSNAVSSGKITQAWTSIGNGRRIPYWFDDEVNQLLAGAGGIISNAADLAKWVVANLNSGKNIHTNVTVIPMSAFEEITTAHFVMNGFEKLLFSSDSGVAGYGAGWGRNGLLGYDMVSHPGGLPGFSSQVSFLPADGVGFVALANSDNKFYALHDIRQRVYKDALGFQEDVDIVNVELENETPHSYCALSNSKLPLSPEAYSGTYLSPGYGAFTLCAPSSDSSYCTLVKSDFAPLGLDNKTFQLLAAWPRVWSSHLRMTHVDNNQFTAEFTVLFPHGYGSDESPFEVKGDQHSVEFMIEGGKVVGFELRSNEGRVDALFEKT